MSSACASGNHHDSDAYRLAGLQDALCLFESEDLVDLLRQMRLFAERVAPRFADAGYALRRAGLNRERSRWLTAAAGSRAASWHWTQPSHLKVVHRAAPSRGGPCVATADRYSGALDCPSRQRMQACSLEQKEGTSGERCPYGRMGKPQTPLHFASSAESVSTENRGR